jgi:hypothetical protein
MAIGGGSPGVAGVSVASISVSPGAAVPVAGSSGEPSGNMPPMFGDNAKTTNLSGEGSPCGGSNAALISGYYAALGVADYLKNI